MDEFGNIQNLGEISTVSSLSFEDRLNDFFALLFKASPDSDDPDEYEQFRLYVERGIVSESQINEIRSDALRDIIAKYNVLCDETIAAQSRTCDLLIDPQMSIYIEDEKYYICLTTYSYDSLDFAETVVTEDLAREFIEIFHERFCDCMDTKAPIFTGNPLSFVKPAKK